MLSKERSFSCDLIAYLSGIINNTIVLVTYDEMISCPVSVLVLLFAGVWCYISAEAAGSAFKRNNHHTRMAADQF